MMVAWQAGSGATAVATAGQRAGPDEAAALPVDGRVPAMSAAPPEIDMRALRRLATAQQAAPQDRGLRLEDIPFGIEVEMENVNFARTWLSMKWHESKWKTEHDGSLQRGAEAVSPILRFDDKGQAQIRDVYKIMKARGGQATERCGLHVHVDARVLGEKGLAVLMRMVRENESLLYRIAQNGHAVHRGARRPVMDTYHYYARPFCNNIPDGFPLMHAETLGEFRSALYEAVPPVAEHPRPPVPAADDNVTPFRPDRHDSARYFGVNFSSVWYRGTVEFRLFDATDDPEQALANVQMVLGMVKAAAEGNYTYLDDNPLGSGFYTDNRVGREQLENFLEKVAPQPALAERLRHTFTASGGAVREDEPVRDPFILRVAGLQQKGYRFAVEGRPVASPFELQRQMGRRPVTVQAPGEQGSGTPLTPQKLDELGG